MKNKNKLIFGLLLGVCICLVSLNFVSALIAESDDYSVGRFGTGIAASNFSSDDYSSRSVTLTGASTRNAENDDYTTNIGFWGNTTYHISLSITPITIYPASAVKGSIIRSSISTLNSESVWANVTLPSGSQEVLTLIKNGNAYYVDYIANSVGTYTVTFYANDSQGYTTSAIGTFEITSPITPVVPGPSGGGGGTTIIIQNCSYVWDCSSWSVCLEGKQVRSCNNLGSCVGTVGKPLESRVCSDALFDVTVKLEDLVLTPDEKLKINVSLIETKGIEKIDVQMKYTIIDINNTEIFSQIETKAIEKSLSYEKIFDNIKLKEGKYILRVDIVYNNLQRAFAEQKFSVKKAGTEIEKISLIQKIIDFIKNWIYWIIIALLILAVLYLIYKLKKKFIRTKVTPHDYRTRIKENLKRIKGRHLRLIFITLASIGLATSLGSRISSFAIKEISLGKIDIGILGAILVLGMLGATALIYRKKIAERFFSRKGYLKNGIKNLIGKEVYLENGDYLGRIKEVFLTENKVTELKVRLHKKSGLGVKGLIFKYGYVKDIGEIAIVSDHLLGSLNNREKKT